MAIKHKTVVKSGDLILSRDWNDEHVIEAATIKTEDIDAQQITTDLLADRAVTFEKLSALSALDFADRTTDPALLPCLLWARKDLERLRWSPDAVKVFNLAHVEDIGDIISSHATAIPIDHPDGSITTAKIADKAITSKKLSLSASCIYNNVSGGSTTSTTYVEALSFQLPSDIEDSTFLLCSFSSRTSSTPGRSYFKAQINSVDVHSDWCDHRGSNIPTVLFWVIPIQSGYNSQTFALLFCTSYSGYTAYWEHFTVWRI